MSEFTTQISEVTGGSVNLRGYSLEDVMRRCTYAQGAHLAIIGRLPSAAEGRLLDAVLNSLLDHGFVASTITAARYVASGNPQFVPAVAGGLLAAGSNTLSPEHAYALIAEAERRRTEGGMDAERVAAALVHDYRAAGRRFPGFGHPTHKDGDFRADVLFDLASELGLAGEAVGLYRAIHREFVRQTGKTTIPINIDGALAAIGKDLGWSANQTVAFAVLSVLPGLMAHVVEEIDARRPLRYITDGEYTGAALRPLPEPANEETRHDG